MLTTIFQEPDSSKTTAIKITLPDNVIKELEIYSDANEQTKSDVIRDAIKLKVGTDEAWLNKLYLFKMQVTDIKSYYIDRLSRATIGSLIKIVANKNNMPNLASAYICNLVRYDDEYVYVEIPNLYPVTSISTDVNNISMASGTIIVPEIHKKENLLVSGWTQSMFVYRIPFDYIWEIEIDRQPQTNFGM